MRVHAPGVSFQKLFAILVALAVLFAPAVASAGETLAPGADHAQMMDRTGHCQMPASGADHDKAAGKSCCIWMCMAVAIEPAAPHHDEPLERAPAVFAIPSLHPGYLGEIATPPPRRA